ncbi:hypothetical protein TorRG33x02_140810 [Trema orientale]|uniref:Transmembrane protein n=1 Tax=Trema orientale TaxID=63057 RepID=A0A2P5EWZ0_TREOI|nr:hypothetical protein TorRG33x02_140810 [Trema orientale]
MRGFVTSTIMVLIFMLTVGLCALHAKCGSPSTPHSELPYGIDNIVNNTNNSNNKVEIITMMMMMKNMVDIDNRAPCYLSLPTLHRDSSIYNKLMLYHLLCWMVCSQYVGNPKWTPEATQVCYAHCMIRCNNYK